MISIIITAWEEPEEIKECLRRFTNQKNLYEDWEILITAPDKPTKAEAEKYIKKFPKKIKLYHQPRVKGKNEMLNLLMKEAKGEILIFTDGDIFVNETAVSEIVKVYQDPEIGAATGKILPKNSRKNLMGYWSHFLTYSANKMRKEKFQQKQFIECSGYLYSIRNGLINDIPLDVAEDSIMPLIIWKKGYKIAYVENALGYVLYPENMPRWISQKIRCAKAHEKLDNYGGKTIRMKTFKNELLKGIMWTLFYPKNIKEFYYTAILYAMRFYIWTRFFIDTRIKKDHYGETWEKIHGSNSNQQT